MKEDDNNCGFCFKLFSFEPCSSRVDLFTTAGILLSILPNMDIIYHLRELVTPTFLHHDVMDLHGVIELANQ